MTETTLPIFRVMGLTAQSSPEHAQSTAAHLRAQFLTQAPNMKAFSSTLYCVYQYPNATTVCITVGRLVANDTELGEGLGDAWVAPQNYVVFELTPNTWADIHHHANLNRRFHADFEIYPALGAPKVYIGVQGDVVMAEEIL